MVVNVDNIRGIGRDGETYRCSADLVIQQSGGRDSIPIIYASRLTDSGTVQVEVSER
jgi:hypothetical protein